MASISVGGPHLEALYTELNLFGPPYTYTSTSACQTTYANFGGPVTQYAMPARCQRTALFSSVAMGDAALFQCPNQMAYRSCFPSRYLASLYNTRHDESCDQMYTFHSPAAACPTGWSLGTQFTLEMTTRHSEVSAVRPSDDVQMVPAGRLPTIAGVHRLCCPSSYQFTGGPSYGCVSLGHASALGNASLCSQSCYPDAYLPMCATSTTNFSPPSLPAFALLTYAVEAVYLIADAPPSAHHHRGSLSTTAIALAATFSVLGVCALMFLVLRLARRRHRKRVELELRPLEFELPAYERHVAGRRRPRGVPILREMASLRPQMSSGSGGASVTRDGGGDDAHSPSATVTDCPPELSAPEYDPPPPYESREVWSGNGRGPVT